jgi:hypothetical protein
MRFRALAAVLLLAAAGLATGCATRARPYRFASPLLGSADIPDATLRSDEPAPRRERTAWRRRAAPRQVGGWQADAQQGPIRSVSARGIEATMPVASASAADAVTQQGAAREVVWSRLPAPHRGPAPLSDPSELLDALVLSRLREPSDLRGLVGTRDQGEPLAIVLDWLADLGVDTAPFPTDPQTLVTWAQTAGRLALATDDARPGDLVVFDRATSDEPADLFAVVIARDARGVTEIVYPGNGVIRRGFLDPTRPSIRRDLDGTIVNTFVRHGKRLPPKGTRYLTGELAAHLIRTR